MESPSLPAYLLSTLRLAIGQPNSTMLTHAEQDTHGNVVIWLAVGDYVITAKVATSTRIYTMQDALADDDGHHRDASSSASATT